MAVSPALRGLFPHWQVLLTSDKAAANFSDRSLLKNLGHWLGMITLAKNKPILYTVRLTSCLVAHAVGHTFIAKTLHVGVVFEAVSDPLEWGTDEGWVGQPGLRWNSFIQLTRCQEETKYLKQCWMLDLDD